MRRIPVVASVSLTVSNSVKERLLANTVALSATGLSARHFGSSSGSQVSRFASQTENTRLFVGTIDTKSATSNSMLRRAMLGASINFPANGMSIACGSSTTLGRSFSTTSRNLVKSDDKTNALQGVHNIQEYKEEQKQEYEEEQKQEEQNADAGYLPFPAPFNTVNIIMILFIANCFCYIFMNYVATDDMRDFAVEHFTVSRDNWWKIYPMFTHSFYQEQLLQLLIDNWLLCQFGRSVLGFLGARRLLAFWAMTCVGGTAFHVGRQQFELYYGLDPLEVRGRCYGPNPFILGLVGVEGLIFRHLNFMQSPPVPFLVMTAFVMIIDVWRIFTTKPEEHGSPTGGALVAYVFWALPTKLFGLSRLTAAI